MNALRTPTKPAAITTANEEDHYDAIRRTAHARIDRGIVADSLVIARLVGAPSSSAFRALDSDPLLERAEGAACPTRFQRVSP